MNPVIESLRVLGALMVLTHHYTYQLSSDLATSLFGLHFFHNGVDLFFVITGFLFAPFLLDEKQANSWKFLKRRFFRLYPLYLVSLITFTLTATAARPDLFLWVEHLFLMQSLPYHTVQEAGAISLVYWTLATEFQFYAFVALLSISYRYIKINNKPLLLFTLSLLGFSASAYINYQPKSGTWLLWQGQLPALLLEFFFGVAIYMYLPKLQNSIHQLVLFITGIVLLVFLYFYYPSSIENTLSHRPFGLFNILSALGYASVMASLLAWHRFKASENPTASKLAILLGGLSYAIYLFHEMAIRWLTNVNLTGESKVLLALLITLFVAWAANRCIEIPFREYGRR